MVTKIPASAGASGKDCHATTSATTPQARIAARARAGMSGRRVEKRDAAVPAVISAQARSELTIPPVWVSSGADSTGGGPCAGWRVAFRTSHAVEPPLSLLCPRHELDGGPEPILPGRTSPRPRDRQARGDRRREEDSDHRAGVQTGTGGSTVCGSDGRVRGQGRRAESRDGQNDDRHQQLDQVGQRGAAAGTRPLLVDIHHRVSDAAEGEAQQQEDQGL